MVCKILRKPCLGSEKKERFANLKTANFHASSFEKKKEKEKETEHPYVNETTFS